MQNYKLVISRDLIQVFEYRNENLKFFIRVAEEWWTNVRKTVFKKGLTEVNITY